MGISIKANKALEIAGWKAEKRVPEKVMTQLGADSPSAMPLFDAVSEVYEIYHHKESDRWIMITDGGGFFTVNAEGLLIASPVAKEAKEGDDSYITKTVVRSIGLDDKTVEQWLLWAGLQNCNHRVSPERGYHYVS